MFAWLFRICALSLLHRGSPKFRFYFEISRGRLNGLRAKNSDSSVRMIRLKEQKSVFTGLWMTFWWLFKAFRQKSLYYFANIHKGFKTMISYCLQHLEELQKVRQYSKSNATCAFCSCLGVSRPFASDTSRSELTEKALEKAVQGLGKQVTTIDHEWSQVKIPKKYYADIIMTSLLQSFIKLSLFNRKYNLFGDSTITEIEKVLSQRSLSLRSLEIGFHMIAMISAIAELFFLAMIWKPVLRMQLMRIMKVLMII